MSTSITAQSRNGAPARHVASGVGAVAHAEHADAGLRRAYDACAEVVRRRARNFYYGLRLTPEPRRSAIYSIYAWMRAADDVADSRAPLEERRREFEAFARATGRVLDAGETETGAEPFWTAFAATVATYAIPGAIFRDMLAGLEDDLAARPIATGADLDRYCYRVASTVGLVCLAIWGLRPGVDRAEAQRLAELRGQAFQRTNILRDFAQDFDDEPSRVYIPGDALKRHGLTAATLRDWGESERCRALIVEQAAIARRLYAESAPLESMIDADCSPTLWAMTRIYSGLLEIVETDPARIVGERRVRLSGAGKATIAIRAAWGARRGWWRT